MNDILQNQFGPLTQLIGIWEGNKGDDLAPADDRGIEINKYRERVVFENAGLVQNHEQNLYVLRYSMMAWRLSEENSFHEELGYWSWEPSTQQVMKNFIIPRGISLIAAGTTQRDSREFTLRAEKGSPTFGICLNPFLKREFDIEFFEMKITLLDQNSFKYEQDTVMSMPGKKDFFHHTDNNILYRVK